MTRYVLSEDADRDLDCIWDYIAEDSLDAADRWIAKLFTAFGAIGDTPGIGHKRDGPVSLDQIVKQCEYRRYGSLLKTEPSIRNSVEWHLRNWLKRCIVKKL